MLHPAGAAYEEAARKSNDLSCVLRITSTAGTVLLTGDIEAGSESELLLRDAAGLRAEVLVVPHHGSRTSSTPPFIAAVSPRLAVIAAGYRNRFGHPRGEILARYARAGAARPRTDLEGAITVSLAPGRPIEAIGERERRRRYWYDEKDR
jgi:competence protein ComEC